MECMYYSMCVDATFRFVEPEYFGNETERVARVCIEKVGRNEIPVSVTYTSTITTTTVNNPATS